jgi:hypothetical protein
MWSPSFRNQLIMLVFLGMSSIGFNGQLITPNFRSWHFWNKINVIPTDPVTVLLHPRCRGGHDHRAHQPPNAGAPPSSARLSGSSTYNAAVVVTPASAVVVLALLAFADERAPPPILTLVARSPPHLSYIPLSTAATTETPLGWCAIRRDAV